MVVTNYRSTCATHDEQHLSAYATTACKRTIEFPARNSLIPESRNRPPAPEVEQNAMSIYWALACDSLCDRFPRAPPERRFNGFEDPWGNAAISTIKKPTAQADIS